MLVCAPAPHTLTLTITHAHTHRHPLPYAHIHMHMLYIENVPCSHYNFRSLFTNENGEQAKRQRQRRSSRWAAFHSQISDCLSSSLCLCTCVRVCFCVCVCVCGCVTTAVSSPAYCSACLCLISHLCLVADLAWPPRRVGVKIAIIHRFNGIAANTCWPLCVGPWHILHTYSIGVALEPEVKFMLGHW